ncbi:hypothetical protein GQ55_5G524900 [Panicum hallii var. hallii]|uniref:RING-type E3 ubiquitin transferase n=1 Tax=Panicum hallii var. hallii TaxID=1504633 RepID=A0A2T7DST9_9POAL|nr:hypothetical protein GQ55_5G524900 [Panicum hallii var. hallii]
MAPSSESLPGDVIRCRRFTAVLAAGAASFTFCVLFVALFLYLRFLLRRWRARRGRGAASSSLVPQEQAGPGSPSGGLDAAAIALLPSLPYQRVAGVAEAECAVCLGALDEGQTVRQLPGCMHVFHLPCVDAWLSSNASCPVCRRRTEPARAEEAAAALGLA